MDTAEDCQFKTALLSEFWQEWCFTLPPTTPTLHGFTAQTATALSNAWNRASGHMDMPIWGWVVLDSDAQSGSGATAGDW